MRRKPVYGRRLLSAVIDERAQENHARPYAAIPVSTNPEDGFRNISYRQFANSINRCATWIETQIGPSTTFEALAYMGPLDLRYQILCMGAVKAGYVMFFPSPRNSTEGLMALFESAKITKFIVNTKRSLAVVGILKQRLMRQLVLPELSELLDGTPVKAVHFRQSFDEYRMQPWMLLHTSGSTGIPEIVTIRHGYASSCDAFQRFDNELADRCGNMRVFNPFPPSQMEGIMWSLPIAIFVDSTIILPPPTLLTVDLVHKIHVQAEVDYSFLPPAVVTELSQNEIYVQNLGNLKGLGYGGGALPQATGDLVRKYVRLHSSYGSTEMFLPPLSPKRSDDWSWYSFNTQQSGIEFRPAIEELYELVVVRRPKLDLTQAIFVTFPDLEEYSSKDLFSKHPTKEGLWRYESRRDDIIFLSNGETFNPVSMEATITSCSLVTGCLIVGQGQSRSALLVEANTTPISQKEREALLSTLWPFVNRANRGCRAQTRIAKELILFTNSEKPLFRTERGTVQRERSIALYESEIEELYDSIERQPVPNNVFYVENTEASLQHDVSDTSLARISDEQDFSGAGLDSPWAVSLDDAIDTPKVGQRAELKQAYRNTSNDRITHTKDLTANAVPADDEAEKNATNNEFDTWLQMQHKFVDLESTLPVIGGHGPYQQPSGASQHQLKTKHLPSPRRPNSLAGTEKAGYNSSVTQRETENSPDQDKPPVVSTVPPDGGLTAWLQVLAVFLLNLNSWGLVNSFGVFQTYYENDFLSDHSPSNIAWIGTIQAGLILIVGVVSGPLFDKGYFRSIVICAGSTLVFALMMLSLAKSYYQVFLAQGLLLGICNGLLYVPSVALIPLNFKRRRGLALGIALSGGSMGGVIYPFVFRRVLNEVGFPWATRVIGFLALFSTATAAFLAKPGDRLKRPTRDFFDFPALRDIWFSTFMIQAGVIYAALLVPFFLAPSFAITTLGASADTAFYLLAVVNAAQFLGRIIPSLLVDYFGPEIMFFGAAVLCGILAFCWIVIRDIGGFVVFLIIYGFATGMIATLPASIVPHLCPSLNVVGTRVGMVYGAAGVGALIGVPIATAAGGASKHSHGAQLWTGCCFLVSAGLAVPGLLFCWKKRRSTRPKK